MLDYNMDHSGMEDQLFIGALSPLAWTELGDQMDIGRHSNRRREA